MIMYMRLLLEWDWRGMGKLDNSQEGTGKARAGGMERGVCSVHLHFYCLYLVAELLFCIFIFTSFGALVCNRRNGWAQIGPGEMARGPLLNTRNERAMRV
jgi:hypothetical protein